MMRRVLVMIAAVLVVGGMALAIVSRQKRPVANTNNSNAPLINSQSDAAPVTNTNSSEPTVPTRTTILTVSRHFSERFGSTSTDLPTGHLAASEPFASTALKLAFKRLAASVQPAAGSASITSRAYAFSVTSFDERSGRAEALVTLQRTERQGNAKPVTYQQNLGLQLLREDGAWKVNAAQWQPR